MKQKINIILICAFLFVNLSVYAQRSSDHQDRWEKYRSEKISFLTDNLELTPAEAQKFWPVYNLMEKERMEAQKKRSEIESKIKDSEKVLSDDKIVALTREFAGSMQKEADLHIKYNEKFLEILPPKKVLNLYKSEREFRSHMFQKYRDKGKNSEKK